MLEEWKKKEPKATYGKLLNILLKTENRKAAATLVELWSVGTQI